MKKILVIGFFAKNLGDDLFLKILFERYNNVQWTMVDEYNNDYKKIFLKYKNVKVVSTYLNKIIRKIRLEKLIFQNYDAVVFIGGSIFMETERWKIKYNYRMKIFKIFNRKPIFFIGCNFGPYKSEEFIENYKKLYIKSKDICFRDKYSYNLFSYLQNVRVAPDIVFQLKLEKTEKIKNTLGISVINLDEREDLLEFQKLYIEKIVKIIIEAINRKVTVTLFSFCELQGDIKIINKILTKIDDALKSYVKIESYNGNIDKFLHEFSIMENIIGTRFHACILSQVFRQGLYPIIYSDKTYNVLKDINLVDKYTYIKDLKNLNEKYLLDIISQNKIKNDKIFFEAEKQFEVLDEYIKY